MFYILWKIWIDKYYASLFSNTFLYSILSILISFLLLPNSFGLISAFIVAFYVHDKVEKFLLENKQNIIEKGQNKYEANMKTLKQILMIYIWIFLTYMLLLILFSLIGSSWASYIKTMFNDLMIPDNILTLQKSSSVDVIYLFINYFWVFWIWLVFSYFFRNYAIALITVIWAVSLWLSTGNLFLQNLSFIKEIESLILIVLPMQSLLFWLLVSSLAVYYLRNWLEKYHWVENQTLEQKTIFNSIVKTISYMLVVSFIFVLIKIIWEWYILQLFI